MPVRYERYRYHRTWLHNHHRLHNVLSYAVFLLLLLHIHTMQHKIFLPDLFLYKFPVLRRPVCLLPLIFQELCQAELLPYNKHNRQLILLYSKYLMDLHKVQRLKAESMGLWSMQGNKHLRLLL